MLLFTPLIRNKFKYFLNPIPNKSGVFLFHGIYICMRGLIKNIIKEEVEDKKSKIVIKYVRSMYKDSNLVVIKDFKISEYNDLPLITIYFRSLGDRDHNIESWVSHKIVDSFNNFFGDSIIIRYKYQHFTKNNGNADIYITTEQL